MIGSPVPVAHDPVVEPGPRLLAHLGDGPGLPAHRRRYGDQPAPTLTELIGRCDDAGLRGRGGAAFPFARKLRSVAAGSRRPVVVVNAAEGEPASAKDAALATRRPHLSLDGAAAAARALGTGDLHLVVPGDRPRAAAAWRRAVGERSETWRIHEAEPRFVAGQARAVLELMAGRPGLPVTATAPEAFSGHRRRPTLLSNAETWAQVGYLLVRCSDPHLSGSGTRSEPGTTLLTLGGSRVVEVGYGSRLRDVLPACAGQVLVGGFHGGWATPGTIASARVSVAGMRALGIPLGAGVVLPLAGCPVRWTAAITAYLADQSARRCGPCRLGLPALAAAVGDLADGYRPAAALDRVHELAPIARGACAHPDGTVRLVRSLLTTYAGEVEAHARGRCVLERDAA